jgi:hypothetical protein
LDWPTTLFPNAFRAPSEALVVLLTFVVAPVIGKYGTIGPWVAAATTG